MSNILVTGGAGFIGAHTALALLNRGDNVTVLDDFNDRYNPKLKHDRVDNLLEKIPPGNIIKGDICDKKLVDNLFTSNNFDKVIHLAAWASVQTSIEKPNIYAQVNVEGTINILDAARKNSVENVVFASSSSVYGGLKKIPFEETDNTMHPISPYAATKVAGEALCASWHHLYQIPISCLRFFTVYGPWGRPEMAMFKFANAILTGNTLEMRGRDTKRDFTYIDDCVQGVISATDNPQGFQVFNLGESDSVPLPRLIEALEASLGVPAKIKEVNLPLGDVPQTLADITKAQKLLNYSPTTKIEDGVQKFTAWYRDWYIPNYS